MIHFDVRFYDQAEKILIDQRGRCMRSPRLLTKFSQRIRSGDIALQTAQLQLFTSPIDSRTSCSSRGPRGIFDA